MALLPCPQHWILRGSDPPPYAFFVNTAVGEECCNPMCEDRATELHHIVRRSYLGAAFPAVWIKPPDWEKEQPMVNLAPVCRECHRLLEENEHRIDLNATSHDPSQWHYTWLPPDSAVYNKLRPEPKLMLHDHGIPAPPEVPHEEEHKELPPGETCPTCGHRKGYPKKKGSPTSKPYPVQIPVDEFETFKEVLSAAAAHCAVEKMPFFAYKVLTIALALVLQSEDLKDYGKRV